ncbi:hypothetical protein [Nocardia sp. NPDC057440]|uniref:hypothetical protein n=1 Tax=Nocardia sp. NPDC057440 TaxID=3346134 RepID=UPI0036704044
MPISSRWFTSWAHAYKPERLGGDYLATVAILNRALRLCQHNSPDAVAVVIIDNPRPGQHFLCSIDLVLIESGPCTGQHPAGT